jgi:two-component system phosphate regulon response regulator PhoB
MSEFPVKATILAVDDEEDILELLRVNLTREGYRVLCAVTGEEALDMIKSELPNLVLLDLMLPGVDGLEVCRRLRGNPRTAQLPIIMLTARSEDADVVVGLEMGADDYVTKPFSPRVLTARIKTTLRLKSAGRSAGKVQRVEGVTVDADRIEARVDNKVMDLTITEFRILELLIGNPGQAFSREQIVDAARGEGYPVTDRSVDVHIVSLRRKLGRYGQLIDTVRGVGYRLRGTSSLDEA